jgi:hypothetical protein
VTHPREQTPDQWSGLSLVHVGADIYVHVRDDVRVGEKASGVLVYHWHTPARCSHCGKLPEADGDHSCTCPNRDSNCLEHPPWHRWQLTACGLHTVVSLEPLTLVNSLACEDGCPSHGWITDGRWVPA